jgi:coenzyme F420-0:L-glutamate ligase / coenzyme F420-1:gamma-L-glutamate ligase
VTASQTSAPPPLRPSALSLFGLDGIPEVRPGDDLARLIGDAVEASGLGLDAADVLVVTHKIVSKAEGRLVHLPEIEPSHLARQIAERFGKDARQVEVVLRESKRIVRMDKGVIIAETAHGLVCANAGVDASNVAPDTVCLLPVDPDASAAAIREALRARFGVAPGVIVSDSFGRPWRVGIVNVAVGVAGLAPLADYRGHTDAAGYELHVSVLAVVAAPPGTGRDLILDPARDLFR